MSSGSSTLRYLWPGDSSNFDPRKLKISCHVRRNESFTAIGAFSFRFQSSFGVLIQTSQLFMHPGSLVARQPGSQPTSRPAGRPASQPTGQPKHSCSMPGVGGVVLLYGANRFRSRDVNQRLHADSISSMREVPAFLEVRNT